MNPFKDTLYVEKNGRIFRLHWRNRYDPISLTLMAVGTGISVSNKIQAGKDAEKIGNASAKIELENAENAKANSIEQARVQAEQGRKLTASQKVMYAASGIRSNVGVPLITQAQTVSDIYKDIGFTLKRGEDEAYLHRSSAAIYKAQGKMAKRQSIWDAVGTGLMGAGSIAFMGGFGGGGGGALANQSAGGAAGVTSGSFSPVSSGGATAFA